MAVFDPHGPCWPFAKSSLLGTKFKVPFSKKLEGYECIQCIVVKVPNRLLQRRNTE